jgi:hypothetical protein
LQHFTNEVGPTLVRLSHQSGWTDYVDIITVGNDKEFWVFFLELGEGSMKGHRKQETAERAALFTPHRVHDLAQT